MPLEIGISPIFNIEDLPSFKAANKGVETWQIFDVEDIKDLPLKEAPKLEKILDTKVVKKTRGKEYKKQLVKNRGDSDVDVVWMIEEDIKKKGATLQVLISSGLEIKFPEKYSARAPT